MADTLKDRIAIVTGGDSGIGAACAEALAEAGADVAILFHSDEEGARATRGAVEARGRRALVVRADVGTEADIEHAFDETAARLGIPDILINSAGLNMSGTPVAEMSLKQWERIVRTDLTGSLLTARRFVRDRKERTGPAAIVNITSIHAEVMRAGGANYDAAKGGQRNLTRTLALEVASQGITSLSARRPARSAPRGAAPAAGASSCSCASRTGERRWNRRCMTKAAISCRSVSPHAGMTDRVPIRGPEAGYGKVSTIFPRTPPASSRSCALRT